MKVWVIEDNDLLRETLVAAIDDATGLGCTGAFDRFESALETLENSAAAERPDLILMDIGLPGLDGIAGTRLIHERFPDVLVVMLTIHEDGNKVFEAICAGASGYLLKPSRTQVVIDAIREVAAGGSPINSRIARKVLHLFTRMAPAPSQDYGLTPREKQVLELLVEGLIQKQVADRLHISEHTVNTHVRSIYEKLHVHSRGGAVAKALQEGLI